MIGLTVIGGGLAGVEAAWAAAGQGIRVALFEMRPEVRTPAHQTGALAELVCSNSLGSNELPVASALLKEEIRRLGSLIVRAAEAGRVPAGRALAVDRERFAEEISNAVMSHPLIDVHREEVTAIPADRPLVIATGPLTSAPLARAVEQRLGEGSLYFFDAVAPVVYAESIDMSRAFWASRYCDGPGDYLNCPLDEREYDVFRDELITARVAELHSFEPKKLFEGCLPVEELGRRGRDTLRFGPMKPVGLFCPVTGKRPFAVVQLRQEDCRGQLLGLVGFQTRLTFPEQRRVFRLIPALAGSRFARLGVMHRNSFLRSPAHLDSLLRLRSDHGIFFAGQITGVEGYIPSAATGLAAGLNAARAIRGEPDREFPVETCIGALLHYVSSSPAENFQPMGINFGLLPAMKVVRVKGVSAKSVSKKKARRAAAAKRALQALDEHLELLSL